MKLIASPIELQSQFKRLIRSYDNYSWATAWAGSSSALFPELISRKPRIKKMVVGIHFYQTHPDFIEAFLNNKAVRFIQQPEGTFHPKLYLFFNSITKWELFIGSANFTNEAFTRNTEAGMLITSEDTVAKELFANAQKVIDVSWKQGKVFTEEDLRRYRIAWELQRPKIKSLSGMYGSKNKVPIPIFQVAVMNRSWTEFVQLVRAETAHGVVSRLKMLEIAKQLFSQKSHFNELELEERKFIAGIPNKLKIKGAEYWPYFGSMKGAGVFKHKIILNDPNISKALDQIPPTGLVSRQQFFAFVKYFKMTFEGNCIGTSTRLLSMKRPDTFVCFDSRNRSKLCKDFGIIQSKMDYKRYWDDVVERIYDCEWWQNSIPRSEIEVKIWESRAAFLDSLYYAE